MRHSPLNAALCHSFLLEIILFKQGVMFFLGLLSTFLLSSCMINEVKGGKVYDYS